MYNGYDGTAKSLYDGYDGSPASNIRYRVEQKKGS